MSALAHAARERTYFSRLYRGHLARVARAHAAQIRREKAKLKKIAQLRAKREKLHLARFTLRALRKREKNRLARVRARAARVTPGMTSGIRTA